MIDIRLTFLENNNLYKEKSVDEYIKEVRKAKNSSNSIQVDISSLIASSKGTYTDEFNNVANELVTIQNSLNTLLTSTISVLENAKDSYIESDKSSADLFEIVNAITK